MKKILVVGSPGAGKSTFSKRLAKVLNYPILHIDRVFHIDNHNQISKEELKEKIKEFVVNNDCYIIDGNYTGSLEFRLQFADTIFFLDIDPAICLENVINRTKSNVIRDDIAPGFDNSIIDPVFIEYVKNFNYSVKPRAISILEKSNLEPVFFHNYDDIENFFKDLVTK